MAKGKKKKSKKGGWKRKGQSIGCARYIDWSTGKLRRFPKTYPMSRKAAARVLMSLKHAR